MKRTAALVFLPFFCFCCCATSLPTNAITAFPTTTSQSQSTPLSTSNKTDVYLALFQRAPVDYHWFWAIMQLHFLAVERVNTFDSNCTIHLQHFNVSSNSSDISAVDVGTAMTQLEQAHVDHPLAAVMGPYFQEVAQASVESLKRIGLPVFSYLKGDEFSSDSSDDLHVRQWVSETQEVHSLVALMLGVGWKRAAVIGWEGWSNFVHVFKLQLEHAWRLKEGLCSSADIEECSKEYFDNTQDSQSLTSVDWFQLISSDNSNFNANSFEVDQHRHQGVIEQIMEADYTVLILVDAGNMAHEFLLQAEESGLLDDPMYTWVGSGTWPSFQFTEKFRGSSLTHKMVNNLLTAQPLAPWDEPNLSETIWNDYWQEIDEQYNETMTALREYLFMGNTVSFAWESVHILAHTMSILAGQGTVPGVKGYYSMLRQAVLDTSGTVVPGLVRPVHFLTPSGDRSFDYAVYIPDMDSHAGLSMLSKPVNVSAVTGDGVYFEFERLSSLMKCRDDVEVCPPPDIKPANQTLVVILSICGGVVLACLLCWSAHKWWQRRKRRRRVAPGESVTPGLMAGEVLHEQEGEGQEGEGHALQMTQQRPPPVLTSAVPAPYHPQRPSLVQANELDTPTTLSSIVAYENSMTEPFLSHAQSHTLLVTNHVSEGAHCDAEQYNCERCPRVFKSRKGRREHMSRTHNGVKPQFHCNVCNDVFTDISNMRRHRKRHDGVKRHVCRYCGKRYTRKQHVTRHMPKCPQKGSASPRSFHTSPGSPLRTSLDYDFPVVQEYLLAGPAHSVFAKAPLSPTLSPPTSPLSLCTSPPTSPTNMETVHLSPTLSSERMITPRMYYETDGSEDHQAGSHRGSSSLSVSFSVSSSSNSLSGSSSSSRKSDPNADMMFIPAEGVNTSGETRGMGGATQPVHNSSHGTVVFSAKHPAAEAGAFPSWHTGGGEVFHTQPFFVRS